MAVASEVDHRNVQHLTKLYDSRDIEQGIWDERRKRASNKKPRAVLCLAPELAQSKKEEMHILHNPLHNAQMAQTHT